MKYRLPGLFILLIAVGGGAYFLLENDIGSNSDFIGEASNEIDPSDIEDGSSMLLQRDPILEKDAGPLSWQEQLDLSEAFQLRFIELFITEGGEAFSKDYVDQKTLLFREGGFWSDLPNAISDMKSCGMAFSEKSAARFEDVVFAEHYHAAGLLHTQQRKWTQWVREQGMKDFDDPLSRLKVVPLNFPPEMHFAAMMGAENLESVSPEALIRAAEIRDQFVREHARVELERFLMLGSINQTIRELGILTPNGDWEEAVCTFLPSYQRVRDSMSGLEEGYVSELRMLLLAEGFELN